MSGRSLISIHDLRVRYPGAPRPALDGVSLDVERGELIGVVGLTEAGKSTLLRCLNGIVPQLLPAEVSGRIEVAGADPATTPVREMAGRIGVVLDDPEAQLSQPSVAEEVALGIEPMALPWTDMAERVASTLGDVGLSGLERRPPLTLSGGEQQRLAVACAIARRPAVLVMDEPTSRLDAAGTAAVFELVERLARERGLAVVLAEHDVDLLAEHADRIALLDQGRLVMAGSPAAVFGRIGELAALGLRVPQVTELADALGDRPGRSAAGGVGRTAPGALPVTLDAAVAWLADRA